MKRTFLFCFFILSLLATTAFSQNIGITAANKPLNAVLIDLRNDYNLRFSFDDELLSAFSVTISGSFDTPEKAVGALLSGLPLAFEKKDDVFLIFPKPQQTPPKKFLIAGKVVETNSSEPLPYAQLMINNYKVAADFGGSFSFINDSDSIFNLKISYLGFYVLDTIVGAGVNHKFELSSASLPLSEIEITAKVIEKATQTGDEPGLTKLNHKVATFLPGSSDNSVYNLLRLQPGILASGESTNDLIIWGSYEGHSQVLFDGFTIYGLKNFNDNIGPINAFVAKDIEIYKGGFDAGYGGRVGGIVNITGKNGNMLKPSVNLSISNLIFNGSVETPVFKNSSLLVAFRQTFYNLYDPYQLNIYGKRNPENDTANGTELKVVPDYAFRDFNVKFSSRNDHGDLFFISLYGGNDTYSYTINQPFGRRTLIKNTAEENTQMGASAFYGKNWQNGNTTKFTIGYSGIFPRFSDNLHLLTQNNQDLLRKDDQTWNSLEEITAQAENLILINENHRFETGVGFVHNAASLIEDSLNVRQVDISNSADRLYLFFQDIISSRENYEVKAGFRLNYATNLNRIYVEPRLSASFFIDEFWKINTAWGLYNQFISKSSVVDENGNFRYIWTTCDNVEVPVLRASHFVLGSSYHRNGFTFSLEGYYKTTQGITRYVNRYWKKEKDIYEGNGQSYGVDFYVQKDLRGNSFWVSYSLGRTEEKFSYFPHDDYRRAPQDQQHEVKCAALIDLNPFYVSADYVFGSGFPGNPYSVMNPTPENYTYSRLDASVIYKFVMKKMAVETGLSVLNVLDTENIKYSNFTRIPLTQLNSINIQEEALPFTPSLFLKLSL